MMGVTHTAVGAAIGKYIPNPWLAFAAGIASHLVIDKIPHFWPEAKADQNKLIVIDGIFSGSLFVYLATTNTNNHLSVLAGAFGGAFVDLVFVILPMFVKSFYNNPIRVWHEKRQYHHHDVSWIISDMMQIGIALGVFFS